MSEWREPTEAEAEDALRRVPGLSRAPEKARERAVRYAKAEAWQRDRGLAPAVGEATREHFAKNVERRAAAMRKVSVKPPDGVTYGRGQKKEGS
jgi:hypothetical protein